MKKNQIWLSWVHNKGSAWKGAYVAFQTACSQELHVRNTWQAQSHLQVELYY